MIIDRRLHNLHFFLDLIPLPDLISSVCAVGVRGELEGGQEKEGKLNEFSF